MKPLNRRTFSKALTGSAYLAMSASRILGANDRINIGIIGCGGQGTGVFRNFLAQPDVTPVAVCDVYDPNRERAAAMCKEKVTQFKDFRQMLERKDIDAVIVGTPDHWHALQTIMACKAGKDVYVEKGLSATVREGRVAVDTARKYKRIVQVGAQERSAEHIAAAMKLIHDGALGSIRRVSADWTRNMMPGFKPRLLKSGLTDVLDWDMWLGPAPSVPFDPMRFGYNWRWYWDYSGGQMTNWGSHTLDIVRWALNVKTPSAVAAFGGRYELKDGGQTPDVQDVIYSFPGCTVSWAGCEVSGFESIRYPADDRRAKPLMEFHGTKGTMTLTRRGYDVTPEIWTGDEQDGKTPAMKPVSAAATGGSHVRNFLDCVKSRKLPNCDVEEGHYTMIMCHLANISMKVGRTLHWDHAKEEVTGDKEANLLLSKQYRNPWALG
ncbi:MAG: Gfo/Idh/MocA family oxidoreductase [Candidatus Solibacter sp.]